MTPPKPPVLVADIGGTHARFALATGPHGRLQVASVRHYAVADHANVIDAARRYLAEVAARPGRAVLSAAGPVVGGRVRFTNHDWVIVAADVARALAIDEVRLINDFAALSMALPRLKPAQIEMLGSLEAPTPGAHPEQTFAVAGPGTGLGVGGLLRRGGQFHILQTEGGHASFAPTSALQVELLRRLQKRLGHVCNEALVSGPGLLTVYRELAEIEGVAAERSAPEQITEGASNGDDALCEQAVQTVCAVFGAVAGDVVLGLGAWDGIYLGGGLSPVLLPWLHQGGFRHHFEDKGARQDVLHDVPVAVITDTDAGLYGAAAMAAIGAA
ncbi:MAG TPA: glucokinase [Rhodanobacteraceae bacterium]|nr:glucokinase [Rhodanobacteraceae bacterium]